MYKKYDFKLEVSDRKGVELSRGMYGLFFEDINYAADGGIYAEFIENRSFEAVKYIGGGRTEFDGLYAWSEYPKDGGRLEISEELPLSKNNPHYLRFTSHGKDCGFSNSAYDGIYAENGDAFNFSFYAKRLRAIQVILRYHCVKTEKHTPHHVLCRVRAAMLRTGKNTVPSLSQARVSKKQRLLSH